MAFLKIVRLNVLREMLNIFGSLRNLTTSSRVGKSHYDVLGITPRATQSDIKSAYYKLSKIYHPDKSSDEASANQFRAISEAYEVLGNVKLKKMYDKGLIVGKENTTRMGWQPEPEPADPTTRFYKSRLNRHVTPTMASGTPVYDFDACSGQKDKVAKTHKFLKTVQEVLRSKHHYGDLFAKAQQEKEFVRKQKIKYQQRATSYRQETTICAFIAITGLCMLVMFNIDDYDKDIVSANNSANKQNSQDSSQESNLSISGEKQTQIEVNKETQSTLSVNSIN